MRFVFAVPDEAKEAVAAAADHKAPGEEAPTLGSKKTSEDKLCLTLSDPGAVTRGIALVGLLPCIDNAEDDDTAAIELVRRQTWTLSMPKRSS